MSSLTIHDQTACVRRALSELQRVLPARVEAREMIQAEADREIACMEHALITLRTVAAHRHPDRNNPMKALKKK